MYKDFNEYVKGEKLSVEDVVEAVNGYGGGCAGVWAGDELLDKIEHEPDEEGSTEYGTLDLASQVEQFMEENGYIAETGYFGEHTWVLDEEEEEVWD